MHTQYQKLVQKICALHCCYFTFQLLTDRNQGLASLFLSPRSVELWPYQLQIFISSVTESQCNEILNCWILFYSGLSLFFPFFTFFFPFSFLFFLFPFFCFILSPLSLLLSPLFLQLLSYLPSLSIYFFSYRYNTGLFRRYFSSVPSCPTQLFMESEGTRDLKHALNLFTVLLQTCFVFWLMFIYICGQMAQKYLH